MTLELAEAGPGPVVLLEASRTPGPWTRYEDQVFAAIPDDFAVRFSGGAAELDGVDVVHFAGSLDRLLGIARKDTAAMRLQKAERFVAQLGESGTALVRTVFGAEPSVGDEVQRLLDGATTTFIVVDGTTETPDPTRTVLIPYADFADRFVGYPVQEQVAGRILTVAPGTLGATAAGVLKTLFVTRVPGLSVRVAGQADAGFATALDTATARTPHTVESRIGQLSDAALIEELTAAELVVVPAAETLADLHLLMLALSFGRPVLVPVSPAMTALGAEVGEGWVLTYEGPITAKVLDDAISRIRATGSAPRPELSARGWEATGDRYAQTLRAAVATARERRFAQASPDASATPSQPIGAAAV